MRFETDVPKVSEHLGFNVTGDLARLKIHSGGVNPDSGVGSLVHRFVQFGVISDLGAQIVRDQVGIRVDVVDVMFHDLLSVMLQDLLFVANALDEENPVTELAGEIVVDFRALRFRDQHSVEDLQTESFRQ